jgi:hypothetical protein
MANKPGFFVNKESDSFIIESFKEIIIKYIPMISGASLSFSSGDYIQLNKTNYDQTFNENELLIKVINNDLCLISRASISFNRFEIALIRGDQAEPPSALLDYIQTNQNNSQNEQTANLSPEDKIDIISFLQNRFKANKLTSLISNGTPNEYESLIVHHSNTLNKLEQINTTLLIDSQRVISQLEIDYASKKDNLESKLNITKNSLEEEFQTKKNTLESEYKNKQNEVNELEKELNKRQAALDDRDNTHVRREIRNKMLDDVNARINNFGVSYSTNRKRRPVFVGIIMLCLVFATLLGMSIYESYTIHKENMLTLDNIRNVSANGVKEKEAGTITPETWAKVSTIEPDQKTLYWCWLRISLYSFGLLGTILYYIKWENKWADYHSTSEFQLQQFYIDINRANWAIESCLEWRKNTDSVIPKQLLESITKNLFTSENTEQEKISHPADELASALLGSSSKLKLNIAGHELEIDKPGKIKPQKP